MNTEHKQLIAVNQEFLSLASKSIAETVEKKKLVLTGTIPTRIPDFPSKAKRKQFQRSLGRVLHHPTMKNINLYLHHFTKLGALPCKLDFSEKEKTIQRCRAEWKESLKKMRALREVYKTTKGDFYKN